MGKDFASVAFEAGMLGTIFYRDPTKSEQGKAAVAWIESEESLGKWKSGQPEADALIAAMHQSLVEEGPDKIHRAYMNLFIGPFRLPAPPWGSVYTDPDCVIFGNLTLALRDWMRKNGVELHLPDKEPEDHFGLMLSMFAFATENGVDEYQIEILLGEHLMPWAFHFLDLFEEGAESGFYKAAAQLARLTLATWRDEFGIEVHERRLYR